MAHIVRYDNDSKVYLTRKKLLRMVLVTIENGSVAISGSYLKECAKNPEKAKEMEENLSYFKEGYENGLKSALRKRGRNKDRHV